jgi:hypothetical protein
MCPAFDLADAFADAVFKGLQGIADGGLANEADDRGGNVLVFGLLPGGSQSRVGKTLLVKFEP